MVTAYLLFGSNKDNRACACVASLVSRDESMCRFTKMGNQKRKLANEDESATKKQKVVILEDKSEWNINGAVEEMTDCENVDHTFVL